MADPEAWSGSLCGEVLPSPIPGQELGYPLGWMIRQAREHVGEPSLRVDVVELGGLDKRVDGGRSMAAFVGACEGPVLAPRRERVWRCLDSQQTTNGIVAMSRDKTQP